MLRSLLAVKTIGVTMFKHLILITAIFTMALSITGCGKSDDSASTTPGGGTGTGGGTGGDTGGNTFTAAEEYAPHRTFSVKATWTPDTPTGTAMINGIPLKVAGSLRSAPRTVDARLRWTEAITRGTNLVTAITSAGYRDSLYCNAEVAGTVTLDNFGGTYRIIIDFPVTIANADGVTNIRLNSGYMSSKPDLKHYNANLWSIKLTKSVGNAYEDNFSLQSNNPIITAGSITAATASTSTLSLTIFRSSSAGSVKVINDANESVLSAFEDVTLTDTSETAYKTVSLTLPYVKQAGVTYRVVYANIEGADSVQTL